MAITFVGSNTPIGTISSGTVNLALPATSQGDLVLLFVGCNSKTAAGPPSTSGYALVADVVGSIQTRRLYVARKFMGAAPDTSVSVPITGTVETTVVAMAFGGVNTTTPLDVAITSVDQQTGAVPNAPAITPVSNDCCIVIGGVGNLDTSVGGVSNYLPSPSVQTGSSTAITAATSYRILSGGAAIAEDPLAWSTWVASSNLSVTIALRPLTASVDLVPVDRATITTTGKTVAERETTPVLKASVGYVGRTVNIPDGLVDNITVDKYRIAYTGKSVEPLDIIRSVTVTQAAVLYRGRIVTPRDIQFEDIPRYAVRGYGSGHWMETR